MIDNLLNKIRLLAGDAAGLAGGAAPLPDLRYVSLTLFFLLLLLFFINRRYKRRMRRLKLEAGAVDSILASFKPGKGLEKNLADFLGIIIPLVEAPGYYFYLLDKKSNNYVLKAVRNHHPGAGPIEPSYSGLAPYQKENYSPPLGIPAGDFPERPLVIREGAVPMLTLPVRGGSGLIRVGPVRDVPRKTLDLLASLGEKIQPALEAAVETEVMKSQVESVSASSEAIRSLTRSALDLDGSLSTLLGLCIRMIDAAGGCFMIKSQNSLDVAVSMGLDKEAEELFRRDREAQYLLHELSEGHDLLVVSREMKEFFSIPSYFAAAGMEAVLLSRVSGSAAGGTVLFWYYKARELDGHRLSALQMLTKRLGDALDRQLKFRDLSDSYLDMLKMLVDTVDNMEPYTVGHSVLISRYSGLIARELRLGEKETGEIMLAGYLHDVGMLGLSGDILFESGKYTDVEFETMKLHAEVGAAIIESTISKSNVASYIRHHHERLDGFGYPGGLKGEEIPLGARIISVADMFNAKLTGRKYREPASFERAVKDLRSAAGSQLDPALVETLIGWFTKKQRDPSRRSKSLGPCWEMRCCPPGIAKNCPAYKRLDLNCWEIEGTSCGYHGSNCRSCVVHTEFMYRTGKSIAGGNNG